MRIAMVATVVIIVALDSWDCTGVSEQISEVVMGKKRAVK